MDPPFPPTPPRKPVLLIVDDEPDILASLESLLASSLPGVEVLTAGSGLKGLAIARATVLDMILSDFRMATMDGVEFLRQARVLQADIPMVLMSADPDPAQRAFSSVAHVVAKPFDVEALIGLARALLGKPGADGAGSPPAASLGERGGDPFLAVRGP